MAKLAALITKNPQVEASKLLNQSLIQSGFRVELSEKPIIADLVVNRNFGMDYDDSDLDFYEKEKIRALNPVSAQRICRDKWLQHQWLQERGFPTAPTFLLKEWKSSMDKGWVLKTRRGMQGRGVSFFETSEDLAAFIEKLSDDRHIVQEKLEFKKELRSYHVGDEIFWFEISGGNRFQGGAAKELSKVGSELQGMSRKLQSDLGLKLAAFDFLITDRIYPVDLNCYPGLSRLQNPVKALEGLFNERL